jgi:hypothetical protein
MMELPKRHATSLYGQPARAHYGGNFGDRARHTDPWPGFQVAQGSPRAGLHSEKSCLSYDVSIVDQSAVSHPGTGACSQSLPNSNASAGTKLGAEKAKTIHDKLRVLCQQRASGMEVVLPIIFTASGGMGEQLQRQYWNGSALENSKPECQWMLLR